MKSLSTTIIAALSIFAVSGQISGSSDPYKDFTPIIPTKAIVKTVVADLLLPYSVVDQWQSKTAFVNYAWDYYRNCFAENWLYSGETYQQRVTCKNQTSSYTKAAGKCTNAKDGAKVQ